MGKVQAKDSSRTVASLSVVFHREGELIDPALDSFDFLVAQIAMRHFFLPALSGYGNCNASVLCVAEIEIFSGKYVWSHTSF